MSVVFAFTSLKGAVVASDGIKVHNTTGVYMDHFDKTFYIDSPPIIGGHAGLTEFQGMTIGEHLKDMIQRKSARSLKDLIDDIEVNMTECLLQSGIIITECDPKIILIGKKDLFEGELEIHTIDFNPSSGKISTIRNIYDKPGAVAHTGDEDARQSALKLIPTKKKLAAMRVNHLKKLAERVIKKGVDNCGNHPKFPGIPACAGGPFLKEMYYSHTIRK